jgi:hypothetical protein
MQNNSKVGKENIKEKLLGYDPATKEGDKTVKVYGYQASGITFISKIEIIKTPNL